MHDNAKPSEAEILIVARALARSHGLRDDRPDECLKPWMKDAETAFRAAHSVIAMKVAELTEALRNARDAIASLETEALGMAVIGFGDPERDTYPIRDELLAKIDAALAPYPERR